MMADHTDRSLSSQAGAVRRQGSRASHLILWLLATLTMAAVAFSAGVGTMWFLGPHLRQVVASTQQATPSAAVDREQASQILWDVWAILEREYLRPEALNVTKMIHGAAQGMVAALGDPNTAFVEPVSAAIIDQDMSGSFEGIGATVDMEDGLLVIVQPLPNSPAEKAGIQAGDVILEVDGAPLKGKTLIEAITLIRGPQGTTISLLVQREGVAEPFIVPVVRDKVELVIIEARMLEDDIAYLRLREFNAVSAKRVREELATLLEQNPKGLVLDLRNNPGGYLNMSVEIASEFLPRGTLVLSERLRDADDKEFRVTRRGQALDIPLVVLVNGGSASASEIVAGAIQANGRGTLIGQLTYGKGSVQNTHSLSDGSSLRVTVAEWLLPDGSHLDGEGLTPDIEIEPSEPIAGEQPEDVQLQRAAEYLLEGK